MFISEYSWSKERKYMSRFCSRCGASVPENTAFCSSCGAPLKQAVSLQKDTVTGVIPDNDPNAQQGQNAQTFAQNSMPQQNGIPQQNAVPQQNAPFAQNNMQPNGMPQQQYYQPQQEAFQGGAAVRKKPSKKVVIIGVCALAAVIAAVVLIIVLNAGSYKDPLKLYKKVLEKGDAKAYASSYFYPDDIFETDFMFTDRQLDALELKADFVDRYGPKAKVSYDIVSCTPVSQKEIVQINKGLKFIGAEKYQIKKCYKMKVIFTYKGSLDVDTRTKTFEVAQTKDGWKFLNTTPRLIYY